MFPPLPSPPHRNYPRITHPVIYSLHCFYYLLFYRPIFFFLNTPLPLLLFLNRTVYASVTLVFRPHLSQYLSTLFNALCNQLVCKDLHRQIDPVKRLQHHFVHNNLLCLLSLLITWITSSIPIENHLATFLYHFTYLVVLICHFSLITFSKRCTLDVWLLCGYSNTTARRMVPAYTKCDVQLIKLLLMMD